VFRTQVEVAKPPTTVTLPRPNPTDDPLPVIWKVLTRDTLPDGDDWVYYALTGEGYENLSKNSADVLRVMVERGWRLDYYEGVLPEPESESE
jgi:hypothetical protein